MKEKKAKQAKKINLNTEFAKMATFNEAKNDCCQEQVEFGKLENFKPNEAQEKQIETK